MEDHPEPGTTGGRYTSYLSFGQHIQLPFVIDTLSSPEERAVIMRCAYRVLELENNGLHVHVPALPRELRDDLETI